MLRTHRIARRLLSILVIALVTRALIPAGYMPGENTLVELCTLDGVRTVLVRADTVEVIDTDPHTRAERDCPWMLLLSSPVLPTTALSLVIASPPGGALEAVGTTMAVRRSGLVPPVRAPPFA